MLARLLLIVASIGFAGLLFELGYRAALASPLAIFAPLRDPALYADQLSDDDYWKLYHRFGGRFSPPASPHPELGWVGAFDRDTIRHVRSGAVGRRRPVLLYGDSFAEGAEGRSTIPQLVNADPAFRRGHYLLNYAVGGYGLDQIYLVLRRSLDHHENPFVIVSLMTRDLDRSVLSVRIGQKPRLRVVDGALTESHEAIDPAPERWFAAHPPALHSYLYRRLLHGGLLPERLAARLRGDREREQEKRELCRAILEATLRELRARRLDYAFLVFHPRLDPPGAASADWREALLREFFGTEAVPYVWSQELMQRAAREEGLTEADLLDPRDGHPAQRLVELVSASIVATVAESEARQQDQSAAARSRAGSAAGLAVAP